MTATLAMPHRLDRNIVISASRDTVFNYFTDSTRWARWWGQGSTIDARPGGAVNICHPGGVQVAGEILEIDPPSRLVFTYGYVSGTPMPPGGSVVTIQLEDDRQGTRLSLTHVFADENVRNEMAQGWRFQLSLFGNLVANDLHAGAGAAVDGWFAAWSEPDTARREALLDRLATQEIRFRDRFSGCAYQEASGFVSATVRFSGSGRNASISLSENVRSSLLFSASCACPYALPSVCGAMR